MEVEEVIKHLEIVRQCRREMFVRKGKISAGKEDEEVFTMAISALEKQVAKDTLGYFIEKYVSKNTAIRLWKPIKKDKPNGQLIMLTDNAEMEWKILCVANLCVEKVLYLSDIYSSNSPEAINIVIDTDYSREDVVTMFEEFDHCNSIEKSSYQDKN